MKNTIPVNQHQQSRQQQQQVSQQQKTRLGPKPEKQNPANVRADKQYQEHEHPEARLSR